MTDKQIIKKFSDNHCLVLENNQISLRENEFTAYRIVLGKSTNELLEFVKDTYLQLKRSEAQCEGMFVTHTDLEMKYKAKEQECEELKKVNEEKNELLAKLGCPTIATARMKTFTLEQQLDQLKEQLEAYKMEAEEGNEINAELKAENEELKQRLRQCWKVEYSFVEQIDQLEASYEELKKCYKNNLALLDFEETNTTKLVNKVMKLEKTLTEIKPTLEFYANSTIGEEQEDGTYRIELSHKYGSSNMYGAPCYYKYNPKPARQALQKIKECEVENEQ